MFNSRFRFVAEFPTTCAMLARKPSTPAEPLLDCTVFSIVLAPLVLNVEPVHTLYSPHAKGSVDNHVPTNYIRGLSSGESKFV